MRVGFGFPRSLIPHYLGWSWQSINSKLHPSGGNLLWGFRPLWVVCIWLCGEPVWCGLQWQCSSLHQVIVWIAHRGHCFVGEAVELIWVLRSPDVVGWFENSKRNFWGTGEFSCCSCVLCFFFEIYVMTQASLTNKNCSNNLPKWSKSITMIGISALFVFRTSLIISSPDNMILAFCQRFRVYKTSPTHHRIDAIPLFYIEMSLIWQ